MQQVEISDDKQLFVYISSSELMTLILGWGKVGQPDTMSNILQQAKMSIVSNQVCQKESYPPIRIPVSESIINLGNGIKYFSLNKLLFGMDFFDKSFSGS